MKKKKSGKKPTQAKRLGIVRSESREPQDEKPKAKLGAVLKGFDQIWESLFTTPVHLDSALSKQSSSTKSIFAQILPSILLRPASQAEALGIGISAGEPWNLKAKDIVRWRAAQLMAERLYGLMVQGGVSAVPIREDFPDGMIQEWEETWGKKTTDELVAVLGSEAPLSLRATRKIGPQSLLASLAALGQLPVRAEVSFLSPMGLRLSGYLPVLRTELYEQGAFEIQDEGSQFMALFALWPDRYGPLLQKTPGRIKNIDTPAPPIPKETPVWNIVDACAGAGGKTLALADALKGKGRVYAYDTSLKKLQALRRRATRAGLNNIQAVVVEEKAESKKISSFKETAHLVLVDAPCSGWGVLRRNPDIKWRQSAEVLTRMPEIQHRLLSQYSELVAPGGRLVYGVCTFRKSETSDVVKKFLSEHPEFVLKEGGYLGPGPCDGFYMQAFERKLKT